jgi:hypothetical protein
MIVDSNATTGLFLSKASETSLWTTVLDFHELLEYLATKLRYRPLSRDQLRHMAGTGGKARFNICSFGYMYVTQIYLE